MAKVRQEPVRDEPATTFADHTSDVPIPRADGRTIGERLETYVETCDAGPSAIDLGTQHP